MAIENDFQRVRRLLGLTTQDLADILGVRRSVLTMAESGRRELPTSALLKFSALFLDVSRSVAEIEAMRGEAIPRGSVTSSGAAAVVQELFADAEEKNAVKAQCLLYAERCLQRAAQLEQNLAQQAHAVETLRQQDALYEKLKALYAAPTPEQQELLVRMALLNRLRRKPGAKKLSLLKMHWQAEQLRRTAQSVREFIGE